MTSINSDQMSSMVLASLNKSNSEMKIAMERLSTGKRINAAGDDAAGLSISSKLRAQVDSLNAAIKNSSDALAMVSTMASNIFIISAASNMIVVQIAEKKGVNSLTFWRFAIVGIPLACVNVIVYLLWIYGVMGV